MKRMHLSVVLFLIITTSCSCWAGGIALGVTRVIYPANAKQVSVPVSNSDNKNRFLIQSWVEDEGGHKVANFVITPPLFVSKPDSENTLRLMYTGAVNPTPREQVYWLNSKAIPAVEREEIKGKNILQIAVLSRIKIFIRPLELPYPVEQAAEKLVFKREGKSLSITNPSPYYVTLVRFSIDGNALPNIMVAPQSVGHVDIKDDAIGSVRFQTVNDYGANTAIKNIQAQ